MACIKTTNHPTPRALELLSIGLLLGVAVAIGYAFLDYPLDDAFITYRYAYNLSQGQGFVYNPGEKILATTAPSYALLLAFLHPLSENIPRTSNLLGTLGLLGTGLATYLLGRRQGQSLLGALAGLLIVTSPITVLSLGMETNLQLFFIALAFIFYDARRPFLWGLSLGLATVIRADAVLLVAVLAGHYLWRGPRNLRDLPWTSAISYLGVFLPFLGYLSAEFGSPLPNSLSAKAAQAYLGFPDYLGWAVVWGRDFLVPWWAYLVMVGVAIMGLRPAFREARWVLPVLLWAVLHSSAYALLGVAGYHWYYAPWALAGGWLVALGVQSLYGIVRGRLKGRQWATPALLLILGSIFYGQANSLLQAAANSPGPRERLYQGVGQWLWENAAREDRIAVMEVGIIGYYAQRPMIDFLGLLNTEVAQALARGDIFWSLAHFRPEHVVLGSVNPLYSYYLDPESWFAHTYRPMQTFNDSGFWGSPITIYQRRGEVRPPAVVGQELGYRLGDGFLILRYDLDRTAVRDGGFLGVTLYWRRIGQTENDLKIFAHLIDNQFRIYGAQDTAIQPAAWPRDQEISTYHFLRVEEDTPPGEYYIEVGIYDPQTLQRLPVFDPQDQPTAAEIVVLQPIQVRP